jgi:hypothetical protein
MRLLGLVLVLALALTGCNQTDTKKQQISDNTTYDVSNVSDKTNNGKAVGKEYGGKGTGYGQVKKIEPGHAVPPLIEAPPVELTFVEKMQVKAVELGLEGRVSIREDLLRIDNPTYEEDRNFQTLLDYATVELGKTVVYEDNWGGTLDENGNVLGYRLVKFDQ